MLALLGAVSLAGCESGQLRELGGLTGSLSDDSPLSDEVRAALRASPETLGSTILVKTLDNDRVRLSGMVDTAALRNTAEQVAGSVPGVAGVVNTLQIR